MLKIYLDACVLNRLTDDRSSERVVAEAEATEHIFRMLHVAAVQWIGSDVLELELQKNPDKEKRTYSLELLSFANELLAVNSSIQLRASELAALGYGSFDAAHLALAEAAAVDVFLTTDDRLSKRAARSLGNLSIRVANPLDWYREVADGTR